MTEREVQWRKLDNAAKIFPPASNNKDPKVFRFSCELMEDVAPGYLQRAVNMTLKRFPFFRSVLKKGLFWYYFEDSREIPIVTEESKPPCSAIYDPNNKGLLFEVSYYKKRLNLEVFHSLSDGTGAIQFLKLLVINYINLKYKTQNKKIELKDFDTSQSQMTIDSFSKYFSETKVKRIKSPKAFRYHGPKYSNYQIGVMECIIPFDKIKSASKNADMTITEYLVTLLVDSIGENMSVKDKKRPVSISVPVNLRSFFPSNTSSNFFSVINFTYDFNQDGDNIDLMKSKVKDFFEQSISKEQLQQRINLFASLENKMAAKLLPLVIKIPVLKIANDISNSAVTAAFSNVGKIDLPEETHKYVKRFSVFTSTDKLQLTMCTFKNDLVVSFTSPFRNNDIHCSFLDRIQEITECEIEVNTNINYLRK